MDKAGMQNIFLYGGNAASGGEQGNAPTTHQQQLQPQQQPMAMYAPPPTDPSVVAMGYPHMMGYFQQGPAAAHAHAAAAMAEQRLAGSYNNNNGQQQQQPQPQAYMSYEDAMRNYAASAGPYTAATTAPVATNWMNYGAMNQHLAPSSEENNPQYMAPWSATSAGVLHKMNPEQDKKKIVRKKHKDKPKRPLSAYNIFFKEERARILESIPEGKDNNKSVSEDGEDGEKKGRKRKKTPHGKIGFESLAKMIGQRWQELKGDKAEKYKKLAAEDMKRYKEQMEIFLTKLEEEKKKSEEGYQEPNNAEEGQFGAEEEPDAKRVKVDEE